MRDANYWVYMRNWQGRIMLDFPDFIELEYARAFNTVGSLSLVLPGYYSEIRRDLQIAVMRSVYDNPPYLDANTVWFITGWEYDFDNDQTTVFAADAIALLGKRIVAYRGNTDEATKTEEWGTELPADDMVRAFVRENLTLEDSEFAPADGNRIMPGFDVEPDTGRFPVTEKDAPFRNVLDVVTEIANDQQEQGRAMLFDVEPQEDGSFVFRVLDTFLGTDRRDRVTFGPIHGNLTGAVVGIDWTDYANVAYVGGEGEDEARLVAPVVSSSLIDGQGRTPYERAEAFVEMPDVNQDSVLEREGQSYIARHTAKITASGRVVNQPNACYGEHFFYGDLVRCDFGVTVFDAVIQSVHVRVNADAEEIEITMSSSEET